VPPGCGGGQSRQSNGWRHPRTKLVAEPRERRVPVWRLPLPAIGASAGVGARYKISQWKSPLSLPSGWNKSWRQYPFWEIPTAQPAVLRRDAALAYAAPNSNEPAVCRRQARHMVSWLIDRRRLDYADLLRDGVASPR
jgi:hypothetical protein